MDTARGYTPWVEPVEHKVPRVYEWEVIHDPTPARIFQGRLFRRIDLEHGARHQNWPDGMRWRNRRTGQMAWVHHGKLVLE